MASVPAVVLPCVCLLSILGPALAATSTSSLGVYAATNDLIVGEVENAPAISKWHFARTLTPYGGLGYYGWMAGKKQTRNIQKGVLAYKVSRLR